MIRRIAEEASANCPLCGAIPHQSTEYYDGSGEKFAPEVSLLKQHELDRDDDFRECPQCGALFFWHDDRALTGSGDGDRFVLTRLSADDAAVLREILDRAQRASDDPAGLAGRLLRLPDAVRDVAAIHLRKRDRELARRLLPDLLEHVARGSHWPAKFLEDFTTAPEDAALVLRELDRHGATAALERLRTLARAIGCSTCRSIAVYPPTKIRLDALPLALGALKRLGVSEQTDVWECPECDSLFYWKSADGVDGGLSRVDTLANTVRACMRQPGDVDKRAIDSLFRCGGDWERLAFALGMRSGPDLVRPLVPRMVGRLAYEPERWLHDALCEFARDPAGAADVLSAIAKLQRAPALVESLATHARGHVSMSTPSAVKVLRESIAGSGTSWVLFSHGTVVLIQERQADLTIQAIELMKKWGPVRGGGPAGDFRVVELKANVGWVVTSHHNDILTLVLPSEVAPNAMAVMIGLLGRGKRDEDAKDLLVVHVEDAAVARGWR